MIEKTIGCFKTKNKYNRDRALYHLVKKDYGDTYLTYCGRRRGKDTWGEVFPDLLKNPDKKTPQICKVCENKKNPPVFFDGNVEKIEHVNLDVGSVHYVRFVEPDYYILYCKSTRKRGLWKPSNKEVTCKGCIDKYNLCKEGKDKPRARYNKLPIDGIIYADDLSGQKIFHLVKSPIRKFDCVYYDGCLLLKSRIKITNTKPQVKFNCIDCEEYKFNSEYIPNYCTFDSDYSDIKREEPQLSLKSFLSLFNKKIEEEEEEEWTI